MTTTYFKEQALLAPPIARAAFSDRQAYVCAELSHLAYFKFEGGHTLDELLVIARRVAGDKPGFDVLEQRLRDLLTASPATAVESRRALEEILKAAGFKLEETFDKSGTSGKSGTQGFLCTKTIKVDTDKTIATAFLAFRGTEPTHFQDIRTDVRVGPKARQLDGESIEFHSGFLDAFEDVEKELLDALGKIDYDQLFLTGHSLGGALAIVATRILAPDVNGACYTFGAPPVGTVDVQNGLKTPVYEIINEIDIVPRLPSPWAVAGLLFLFRFFRLLGKIVTWVNRLLASGTWDERFEAYMQSIIRYRHPGYRSYLVGVGASARLRYNVNSYDLFKWWLKMVSKRRFRGFKKMVSDHLMEVYLDKITVHGLRRQ